MTEEPLSIVARAAAGDFEGPVKGYLQGGFRRFLEAGGALPLERCLRLPTTPKRLQKARRDYWLRIAWDGIEASTDWARSVELARRVQEFRTLGIWQRWREHSEPPGGASELRAALFYAFKAGAKVPETAQGLDSILRPK
jgi:hypothetical protein